jgi:hypothetical protein
MTDAANSEVISAFVDNEPFAAAALARALAEPGGRDLLIDFIALRHLVSTDGASDQRLALVAPRPRWRGALAAAAVIVALVGGYAAGRERAALSAGPDSVSTAPRPTRVVELRPGVEWQVTNGGR